MLQATIAIPLEEQITKFKVSPINNLGLFISNIVSIALVIAAIACFGYLVYGGIRWIMAGSDSGKLEEAKQTITNAIIGLAVTAATWAIFLLLNYFLGLGVAMGGSGGVVGSSKSIGSGAGGTDSCGNYAIGDTAPAGAVGGYCGANGNTRMKCVAGGDNPENVSQLPYAHLEPVCCISGSPEARFTFLQGGMCPQ